MREIICAEVTHGRGIRDGLADSRLVYALV